jgi:hypothetical protein
MIAWFKGKFCVRKEKNIMSDLISKMQKVANQLDSHNYFNEANYITSLMIKIAQKPVDLSFLPIDVQKAMNVEKAKQNQSKLTPQQIQERLDKIKSNPKMPKSEIFSGGENGTVYDYTDEQIIANQAGKSPEQLQIQKDIEAGLYDYGGSPKVQPLKFDPKFLRVKPKNYTQVPQDFYNENKENIEKFKNIIQNNFSEAKNIIRKRKDQNLPNGQYIITVLQQFLNLPMDYAQNFTDNKGVSIFNNHQFSLSARELKQDIYSFAYGEIKKELCELVVMSVNELVQTNQVPDEKNEFADRPVEAKKYVNLISQYVGIVNKEFNKDLEMQKDNLSALEEKSRADYVQKLNKYKVEKPEENIPPSVAGTYPQF